MPKNMNLSKVARGNLRASAKSNYIIKQKFQVVNDAIADALGENGSITQLDTSDLVTT